MHYRLYDLKVTLHTDKAGIAQYPFGYNIELHDACKALYAYEGRSNYSFYLILERVRILMVTVVQIHQINVRSRDDKVIVNDDFYSRR